MKKDQIGIVSFSVMRRGTKLCDVKVYRDGRVYRSGNGTKPCGDFILHSHLEKNRIFTDVMRALPEQFISGSNHSAMPEVNDRCTSYHLRVSGGKCITDSLGAEHWQFTQQTVVVFDPARIEKNPGLSLIRRLGEKMLEVTDQLYLDALIASVFEVTPENFPAKSFIQGPGGFADKAMLLEKYLQEIRETGKWDHLMQYAKSGLYTDARRMTFKLHSDVYAPEKVIMKPWYGEVMSAGIFGDSMLQQNISLPKYERGLETMDSEELPVYIVLPIFAISIALIGLVYVAMAF